MEIFKLFESTIASVQPGHSSLKDLRRDQILNRYDEVSKSLKTLIQSKESEIVFRKHLIDMLEKSKHTCDNKLAQTRQAYQSAKKYVPVDSNSVDSNSRTPTKRASADGAPDTSSSTSTGATTPAHNNVPIIPGVGPVAMSPPHQQAPKQDTNASMDTLENRTSLDQRLSEFMKTFPNLTQASLAQPPTSSLAHQHNNNNNQPNSNHNNALAPHNQPPKPLPGYYTQQLPPPPPPTIAMVPNAPPIMDIMRFPPPPMQPGLTHPGLMAPIQFQQQPPPHHLQQPHHHHNQHPQQQHHHHHHHHHQAHHPGLENNDATDMELSDYDETSPPPPALNPPPTGGLLPMIASAMQQGAGGSKHVRSHHASPNTVYQQQQQHYHHSPNSMHQYIPGGAGARLAPSGPPGLAFDPAIMDPRDKQRSSSSSSTDKNKYHSPSSSSSSSSRGNKRR